MILKTGFRYSLLHCFSWRIMKQERQGKGQVRGKRGMLMEEKKVRIVHLQMVKDREIVYGDRRMENPQEAAELMKDFLGDVDRECLAVCGTDAKMKPVYIQVAAIGSVTSCPVSMPDIFKAALLSNAVNIFLFHNHLSGDVQPSRDDLLITERVKKSGELLGIRLLDHIILGDNGAFYSLRENGGIL